MKNTIIYLLVFSLTSCGTVHKIFHKEKTHTDSTAIVHEAKDSTVKKDSSALHKDNASLSIKTDTSKQQENVSIKETITQKEYDTTGRVKKKTVIERTIEKSKGKQAGIAEFIDNHSRIDSSNVSTEATKSEVKNDTTKLKQTIVKKDSEKKKTVFEWWWFLLIIPAYFLYRNRKGIVSLFIHLFTGL